MVGLVESVLFGELGELGNKRLDYRRPFSNEDRTGLQVLSVLCSIITDRGSRVTGRGRAGGRFARREGMGGFLRGSV